MPQVKTNFGLTRNRQLLISISSALDKFLDVAQEPVSTLPPTSSTAERVQQSWVSLILAMIPFRNLSLIVISAMRLIQPVAVVNVPT